MIPSDVENAVAAQKIQVRLIIHVIEVRALGSRVDLVEPDYSLCLHQRRVYVADIELVNLPQPPPDNFPLIKKLPTKVFAFLWKSKILLPVTANRLRAQFHNCIWSTSAIR